MNNTLLTKNIEEWVPDREVKRCSGCDLPFNLFRRRHHCRICGEVFCDTCTSFRVLVKSDGTSARVCGTCHALAKGKSIHHQDDAYLHRMQDQKQQQEKKKQLSEYTEDLSTSLIPKSPSVLGLPDFSPDQRLITKLGFRFLSYFVCIISLLILQWRSTSFVFRNIDLIFSVDEEIKYVLKIVTLPCIMAYSSYQFIFKELNDSQYPPGTFGIKYKEFKKFLSPKSLLDICMDPNTLHLPGHRRDQRTLSERLAQTRSPRINRASHEKRAKWLALGQQACTKLSEIYGEEWKRYNTSTLIQISTKELNGRTAFRCSVNVKCDASKLFKVLWDINRDAWDKSTLVAQVIENLADGVTEITHHVAAPIGLIGVRDYVQIRSWEKQEFEKEYGYVLAGISCDDHPAIPARLQNMVRGKMALNGFVILPTQANRCLLVYIENNDFGGWVPSFVMKKIRYWKLDRFIRSLLFHVRSGT